MSSAATLPIISADLANSLPLDDHDLLVLRKVDQSLANALEVKRWWSERDVSQSFAHQFNLIQSFNRPTRGTGFFDSANVNGTPMELMGVMQEMLYDRADTGAAAILPTIRDELQEFIGQYFMRITDFRSPEAAVDDRLDGSSAGTSPFSWCSRSTPNWQGFGYSQLYYKLKDSGLMGKFAEDARYAIVDIRELGKTFEWIVMKVRIFNFNISFQPLGTGSPVINIPLNEETYVILHKDFIVNIDKAGEKYFCEYGFGYGLLQIDRRDSLLAYGPGFFNAGFQTIHFQMLPDGQTSVRLVFVVNRPERLVNVPLDPVQLGFAVADLTTMGSASRAFGPLKLVLQNFAPSFGTFDPILTYIELANLLTGGEAARQLCISKEQLEKEMLVQHFMQHYEMIVGSLLTWRQIPDWLDSANLPDWIRHGTKP